MNISDGEVWFLTVLALLDMEKVRDKECLIVTMYQTHRQLTSMLLVKNYKDSFILRFHMKSEMATTIFDRNPRLKERDFRGSEYKEIVVLQVMLCGEQELLAEIMWKEDFDKLYEPRESEDNA